MRGESECLPCIDAGCIQHQVDVSLAISETEEEHAIFLSHMLLNADKNELCGICFTSELGEESCVRLSCRHVFHANCVAQMLKHRYSTLKINFGYMDCPTCKTEMHISYKVP